MRILTVRQPWALHIIKSGKDVENRVRNVAGDYRGPVAIHAGLTMDDEAMRALPMHAPNGIPRSFWTGVIIGVVDLVDAHRVSVSGNPDRDFANVCWDNSTPIGEICSPWAEPMVDGWHLQLANPRPLTKPIPYKGALGLRTLPDDITAQLTEETR